MKYDKRFLLAHGSTCLSRRQFVTGIAAGSAIVGFGLVGASSRAAGNAGVPELHGQQFDLDIGYRTVNFTGRERTATIINGSIPGPVL